VGGGDRGRGVGWAFRHVQAVFYDAHHFVRDADRKRLKCAHFPPQHLIAAHDASEEPPVPVYVQYAASKRRAQTASRISRNGRRSRV
jgi:hypothetical protein